MDVSYHGAKSLQPPTPCSKRNCAVLVASFVTPYYDGVIAQNDGVCERFTSALLCKLALVQRIGSHTSRACMLLQSAAVNPRSCCECDC
jgi:hypothetical protein